MLDFMWKISGLLCQEITFNVSTPNFLWRGLTHFGSKDFKIVPTGSIVLPGKCQGNHYLHLCREFFSSATSGMFICTFPSLHLSNAICILQWVISITSLSLSLWSVHDSSVFTKVLPQFSLHSPVRSQIHIERYLDDLLLKDLSFVSLSTNIHHLTDWGTRV